MYNSLINRALLDQMPGFYGILNLNSRFEAVNKTGAAWTGFISDDGMNGLSYADCRCQSAEDADIFLEHDNLVKEKGHIRFLGYYRYADNNWKTILGEKYLIRNNDNQAIGFVSHFNDFSHSNIIDVSRFLINSNARFLSKKNNKFIHLLEENHNQHSIFTLRQMECLFFLLRAKSIKEIAKILNLSPRTIEEHIYQIKLKLNCKTISEIIEIAIIKGYMNMLPESILKKLANLDV